MEESSQKKEEQLIARLVARKLIDLEGVAGKSVQECCDSVKHFCNDNNKLEEILECEIPLLSVFIKENPSGKSAIYEKMWLEICLPVLQNGKKSKLLTNMIDLSGLLATRVCDKIFGNILNACIASIETYNKEILTSFAGSDCTGNHMAILTTLQLIDNMLSSLPSSSSQMKQLCQLGFIAEELIKSLFVAEHQTAAVILLTLCKMFKVDEQNRMRRLTSICTSVQQAFACVKQSRFFNTLKDTQEDLHNERAFMIICGMADWFIPTVENKEETLDIRKDWQFWMIVQIGLCDNDALTRKRATYLLKRALDLTELSGMAMACSPMPHHGKDPLFWWDKKHAEELASIWQDFILIIETLQETQVHVIKPLMPRLHTLIQAAQNLQTGFPLMHMSWICVIVQRASCHESSYVLRWAVSEFLNLQFTQYSLMEQGMYEYICGPLVKTLANTTLYYKYSN